MLFSGVLSIPGKAAATRRKSWKVAIDKAEENLSEKKKGMLKTIALQQILQTCYVGYLSKQSNDQQMPREFYQRNLTGFIKVIRCLQNTVWL